MTNEATIEGVGLSVGEEGMGAPAVILSVRDEVLPIFISPGQAQSIEAGRQDVPTERPLTHDLLIEMITDFGGSVDKVRIDDLADGTFYAKIDAELFREGNREKHVFDARPSDGLALATRVNCPVLVTDDVMDEAGQPRDSVQMNPDSDVDFAEFEDR